MAFPTIPEQLKGVFDTILPGFWSWWQAAKKPLGILAPEKGGSLILTNNAGTVTKRIRLNDIGDGIIIEDV